MRFRMKRRGSPTVSRSVAHGAEGGAISSGGKKGALTKGLRIGLGLFFSVFLAVGIAGTYGMLVKPWMNVWAARSWVAVPCVVLTSEVRSHSGDSTTYSVAITYRYEVDGQAYTGNRYDFSTGSSSGRKAKREIVKRYRKGLRTECYVNPANPAEAVIERSRVRDWAVGLVPLVFVLAGGGGVCFAIFGQRKAAETSEGGRGGARGLRRVAFVRPGGATDDFYAVAAEMGGPVELKPVHSRLVKLVTILAVALFWNGIVSVFVVNIVSDALRGGLIMWLFLLFLLPFIGIGLFLIGMVVQMTMALANPVPRLTVNRRAFAPGDTVELAWRFDGNAARLKDVRLFLEGREEATYRRGTDTKTDREVFATLELAAATGMAAGQPGQARLKLPGRMMHSFKSDNNSVSWVLRIKGGIAWWPDLDEEFAMAVVPGEARSVSPADREEGLLS